MSLPFRLSSRVWLIFPLCAFGFILWTDYGRMKRVEYVSGIDREEAAVDASSPTGYSGGKRWLIVPERNHHSYQWITETQQMLARHEWRVRHVDYDNAPFGREVHSASPYRWWLGLIAWCDHAVSGRPPGLSVEKAALFADPLLHLLLLVSATIFVARQFGVFPAALFSLGLATVFPLAASFLPGVPDDYGLGQALALWSILLLLAGTRPKQATAAQTRGEAAAIEAARASRRTARWFFAAGVVGGCGIWVSPVNQVPIVAGIALGAILAAAVTRGSSRTGAGDAEGMPPWRAWALGGATSCLLAYLVEYYPAHMDLQLQVNHPLYGLAWLGIGELLAWFASWMRQGKLFGNRRDMLAWVPAAAAVAALPVAMVLTGTRSFLLSDLLAYRLTNLPDGVVAGSLFAWIDRDGFTGAVGATFLPLLLLGPAAWVLARRQTGTGPRTALAIALGPVLLTLSLAFRELRWWSMFDGVLLALVVAAAAVNFRQSRWLWSGTIGVVLLSGLFQLFPPTGAAGKNDFTRFEVEGLVERALAHWILEHAGPAGAVILAPPDRTMSLCFYGGLRGLGTPHWENQDGLTATARILSATVPDTALTLLSERGVTHIILPSWDADLDAIVRLSSSRPENTFLYAIHNWSLAPWLRALPYKLPVIAGFEEQSVVILEVTEENDRTVALSRLTEYFIEMGQLDLARSTSQALLRYPADLGALVALSQVENARGDEEGFTKDFKALISNLSSGSVRALAWDRRISLAAVLALGGRTDLAREQVRRCMEKLDEARIRSLTTASLYRLQVLGKAFDLRISDQGQRELALKLLPAELRARL